MTEPTDGTRLIRRRDAPRSRHGTTTSCSGAPGTERRLGDVRPPDDDRAAVADAMHRRRQPAPPPPSDCRGRRGPPPPAATDRRPTRRAADRSAAWSILVVGLWFFSTRTLGIDLPHIHWSKVWPVILIVLGVWIVARSFGRTRDR